MYVACVPKRKDTSICSSNMFYQHPEVTRVRRLASAPGGLGEVEIGEILDLICDADDDLGPLELAVDFGWTN